MQSLSIMIGFDWKSLSFSLKIHIYPVFNHIVNFAQPESETFYSSQIQKRFLKSVISWSNYFILQFIFKIYFQRRQF